MSGVLLYLESEGAEGLCGAGVGGDCHEGGLLQGAVQGQRRQAMIPERVDQPQGAKAIHPLQEASVKLWAGLCVGTGALGGLDGTEGIQRFQQQGAEGV